MSDKNFEVLEQEMLELCDSQDVSEVSGGTEAVTPPQNICGYSRDGAKRCFNY